MDIKRDIKTVDTIEEYINALKNGYIHVSLAYPMPLFFGLNDVEDCEHYISQQIMLIETLRKHRHESSIFKYSYVSAMMATDENGILFALDADAALTEAMSLVDIKFADIDSLLMKLADCFERIGDCEKAAQCYIKASEFGDIMAKFHLAQFYENGIEVSQDYEKAAELYTYVAENSDELSLCGDSDDSLFPKCDAEYALGNLYEKSLIPNSTIEISMEWYLRAFKNGSYNAALRLAEIYLIGKGVAQDYSKSASCLINATEMWGGKDDEHIFPLAKQLENKEISVYNKLEICRLLHHCYSRGVGTDMDHAMAEEYANKISILEAQQEKEYESWLKKLGKK